ARQRAELGLRRNLKTELRLREDLHAPGQLGDRLSALLHHREQRERGHRAVAGVRVVEEDQVAALLAAERVPAVPQLLDDVAIADAGPHDTAARPFDGLIE